MNKNIDRTSLLHKNNLLTLIVFLVSSFVAPIFSLGFEDFKLDYLAYQINDYNSHVLSDSDFKSSIITIQSHDSKATYLDLLSAFYYNSLNKNVRLQLSKDVSFNSMNLHLLSQDTFSIRTEEEKDGGYYLDKGLYYTYYSDDILGPREYLKNRFDCDTFIFISDSFADKLVNFYGLQDTENPYRILIQDKRYCVLDFQFNGNILKFCINNIIYTNKRNAPRTKELYGDFAVFYRLIEFDSFLDYEFEIDLKDNPFCIKQTFKSINSLGYTISNSNFLIKTFDRASNSYSSNIALSQKYHNAWKNNSVIFIIAYILLILVSMTLLWLLSYSKCNKNIFVFLICFAIFFIYGIVSSFIYSYALFTLPILIQIVFLLILYRREVANAIKVSFFRKSHILIEKQNDSIFEIKI